MVVLLLDIQVSLTSDTPGVRAIRESEQETGEGMAGGGQVLRIGRSYVVELEIQKHRIVNGSDFRVIPAEGKAVLIDNFRHREGALIREVWPIDQVAVPWPVYADDVEVNG